MKQKNDNSPQINERIRFPEVRVIGNDGANLGVMHPREALAIAREKQLDLVLLNDKSAPPVCRIVDYGKYKYEQEKRQRNKSPKVKLKELKMRYTIEEHDYSVRVAQAKRFLQAGDQVKACITMRGRENQHHDLAESLLLRMAKDLQEFAQVQQAPKKEGGGSMIMMLVPKQVAPAAKK